VLLKGQASNCEHFMVTLFVRWILIIAKPVHLSFSFRGNQI